MRYLVDTNVISELGKRKPDPKVIAFLQYANILISCIVIAELAFGAHKLPDRHPGKLGYLNLVENLKRNYSNEIVPITTEIAEISGRLRASEKRKGRILEMADALIAATSVQTKTTLVTRNTKDFDQLNISLLNPFSA